MGQQLRVASVAVVGLACATGLGQCFDDPRTLLEPGDPSWRCNGTGVAADGLLAVVGNPCGEESQPYFGYATVWTLDPASGEWSISQRLNPSDGDINGPNQFGETVAISGPTVVVGAHTGSYPDYSGAAYVYEEANGVWSETARLEAADPARSDTFGWSVAVDGDWMLIGAIGDDGQDTDAGAAYFFHRVNGQWTRTQRVAGSQFGFKWSFGWSVDIDGDTAVIGAPQQLGNRAFVFERDGDTWSERAVLVAHDQEVGDWFGHSVAISGDTIVVCAPLEDETASNAGAAYIFERDPNTGQWSETQKITRPGDSDNTRLGIGTFGGRGAAIDGDRLIIAIAQLDVSAVYKRADGLWAPGGAAEGGDSVGLRAGAMISGDRDFDGGGKAAVATCPIDADPDGDGLPDSWETDGVPFTASDGTERRYLLDVDGDGLSDADPMHNDLFVELDRMSTLTFSRAVVEMVQDAFWASPVPNPDGVEGITLHIVVDDDYIPFEAVTPTPGSDWPDNAAPNKELYFGTLAEQADPDASALLAAKARAYRYCIMYNKASTAIGGLGELGGDDFVIFTGGYPDEFKASVFMHELGHCLGLHHGGADEINMKPNYPSIMNYVHIYRSGWNRFTWKLDYSRERLATIVESRLDEPVGVGLGGSGYYAGFIAPYYSVVADGAPCFLEGEWGRPLAQFADLDPGGTQDYNLDCDEVDTDLVGDLNYLQTSGLPGSGEPSPGETLHGYDDWANLVLPVTDGGGAFAGPVPPDELTDDQALWMRDNFPAACVGDWDRDGAVNTLDFLAFLNDWASGAWVSDLNFDGLVNTLDFLQFLNTWAAGCP